VNQKLIKINYFNNSDKNINNISDPNG